MCGERVRVFGLFFCEFQWSFFLQFGTYFFLCLRKIVFCPVFTLFFYFALSWINILISNKTTPILNSIQSVRRVGGLHWRRRERVGRPRCCCGIARGRTVLWSKGRCSHVCFMNEDLIKLFIFFVVLQFWIDNVGLPNFEYFLFLFNEFVHVTRRLFVHDALAHIVSHNHSHHYAGGCHSQSERNGTSLPCWIQRRKGVRSSGTDVF